MDNHIRTPVDTAARQLSTEALLLRVALLARYGADSRTLSQRLSAVSHRSEGRSCFEGGAAIQLAIDAPGDPVLQVGIRLGPEPDATAISALLGPGNARRMLDLIRRFPPGEHVSMGFWLHWEPRRPALFMDLRDADPARAEARLMSILDADQQKQFDRLRPDPLVARLWAAKLSIDETGKHRVLLYWLINRSTDVGTLAEQLLPGSWQRVLDSLGHLVRRPRNSGRWALTTPLQPVPGAVLRLTSTGWLLAPEDDSKQRALARVMAAHGGPTRYAESLWSLCRTTSTPGWRVGRSCEISVGEDTLGIRAYLTPQTS